MSEENYKKQTVVWLKKKLKKRNLSQQGTKQILISRLLDSDQDSMLIIMFYKNKVMNEQSTKEMK